MGNDQIEKMELNESIQDEQGDNHVSITKERDRKMCPPHQLQAAVDDKPAALVPTEVADDVENTLNFFGPITAEQRVFQNCLTLTAILKHSTVRDLIQNFRLVNKTCHLESSKCLLQRSNNVSIEFNSTGNDHRCSRLKKSLSQFSTIIQNSAIFPCTNFKFCGGNLLQKDFADFTAIFGSMVKSLHLEGVENFPDIFSTSVFPTLSSFIGANFPNLVHLSIGDLFCQGSYPHHWLDPLTPTHHHHHHGHRHQLKFIQTIDLNVPSCGEFVLSQNLQKLTTELLASCPNLKRFKNFDPADLQVFLIAGKIHVIKEFVLVGRHSDDDHDDEEDDNELAYLLPPNYFEILEHFLTHKPPAPISSIVVEGTAQTSKKLTLLWQRIFSLASGSNLKKLSIQANQNLSKIFPPNFILAKLRTLIVKDFLVEVTTAGASPVHAKLKSTAGVDLAKNFPNVTTLELHVFDDDDDFYDYSIQSSHVHLPFMPSVRDLRIYGAKWSIESKMSVASLTNCFKNVRKLKMVVSTEHLVDDDFLHIFNWTQLHSLHLIIVANEPTFASGFNSYKMAGVGLTWPVLDSVFTGISEKVCSVLRTNFEKGISKGEENDKLIGGRRCVLDWICLRSLRIELRDAGSMEGVRAHEYRRHHFPISPIASLYGFQLMPQLEVSLSVKADCFGPENETDRSVLTKELGQFFEIIS